MRLLLDTHTWVWYYLGDSRLSKSARSLIEDASNSKLVSPASCWELAVKVSIGKFWLAEPFDDVLQHAIIDNGFSVLAVEMRHLVEVSRLPFPPGHEDPFDRLLVSQAMAETTPVVSIDAYLDAYSIRRLW